MTDSDAEHGQAIARDPLREASRRHRHDDLDIITVPKGRALLCHTCQRPVAEDRGVTNR